MKIITHDICLKCQAIIVNSLNLNLFSLENKFEFSFIIENRCSNCGKYFTYQEKETFNKRAVIQAIKFVNDDNSQLAVEFGSIKYIPK